MNKHRTGVYKTLHWKASIMVKIVRNQKVIDDIKKKMSLWVEKSAFYLETKMKDTAEKSSYDTGDYIRSFYTKMKSKYKAEVGNTKWYARVIEYWRKPWTYPNFDALVGWTARKFKLPGKTWSYDNADPRLKSKVFLVARAIMKRGIEPKEIMQKTYIKQKSKMVDIFRSVFR